MKGHRQGTVSARRAKTRKECLSGWSQEEECLLQEEIGIDTWYEDRKQSGRERGYVCALVESFERQEIEKLHQARNSSSRKSHRQSAKVNDNSLTNQHTAAKQEDRNNNKTTLLSNVDPQINNNSPSRADHVLHVSGDPIGESTDHMIVNQSEHNDDVSPKNDVDWSEPFVFHANAGNSVHGNSVHGNSANHNGVESPPQNLALVNLTRYEEKLRQRRENRLRKSMEIINKTEMVDPFSLKQKANITSVTFAEGMIQPISGVETKRTTHQSDSKTKLPFLFKQLRDSSRRKTSAKVSRSDSFKTTEYKNTQSKNGTKFDFDILEKYALIRNSQSKATFTDYVEKIRCLRNCSNEDDDYKPEDNVLKEVISKGGSQSLRRVTGDSLTFEHVRELWYKTQSDRIALNKGNRRTKSLPPYGSGARKMVVDDVKRNRCMTEPTGDKETRNLSSLKGKPHTSKHRCPLQRMLSATNKRLEANKFHDSGKVKNKIKNTENETVGLSRTKNGITCCILGRSSPSNNQTGFQ